MELKKAPGPNERQSTEDFAINERRGSHSGKYGIFILVQSSVICNYLMTIHLKIYMKLTTYLGYDLIYYVLWTDSFCLLIGFRVRCNIQNNVKSS